MGPGSEKRTDERGAAGEKEEKSAERVTAFPPSSARHILLRSMRGGRRRPLWLDVDV